MSDLPKFSFNNFAACLPAGRQAASECERTSCNNNSERGSPFDKKGNNITLLLLLQPDHRVYEPSVCDLAVIFLYYQVHGVLQLALQERYLYVPRVVLVLAWKWGQHSYLEIADVGSIKRLRGLSRGFLNLDSCFYWGHVYSYI